MPRSPGGVQYNGGRTPCRGERRIKFTTNKGQLKAMTFQVAPVVKPLAAVSGIVHKGNRVIFDDVSYIENKITKEKVYLTLQNGVYHMPAWLTVPNSNSGSDFQRQGHQQQ